jgi:endonuclease YncB( thermonuclease family)
MASTRSNTGAILGAEMPRVVLLSAGALGLVLVLAASAQAPPPAVVRITDRDPLTLKGRHFKAGERVRLAVTLKRDNRTHKVRASSSGTFESAFADLKWERCNGNLTVVATGSRGSHVEFTTLALHCVQQPRLD